MAYRGGGICGEGFARVSEKPKLSISARADYMHALCNKAPKTSKGAKEIIRQLMQDGYVSPYIAAQYGVK